MVGSVRSLTHRGLRGTPGHTPNRPTPEPARCCLGKVPCANTLPILFATRMAAGPDPSGRCRSEQSRSARPRYHIQNQKSIGRGGGATESDAPKPIQPEPRTSPTEVIHTLTFTLPNGNALRSMPIARSRGLGLGLLGLLLCSRRLRQPPRPRRLLLLLEEKPAGACLVAPPCACGWCGGGAVCACE